MYLIFIALAAFFYAVNQKVQHHYSTSIFFGRKPEKFWNPALWNESTKIFRYPVDARHITASLCFLSWTVGIVCTINDFFIIKFLNWWQQICVIGTLWIIVFNIFFNRVLVKKKP